MVGITPSSSDSIGFVAMNISEKKIINPYYVNSEKTHIMEGPSVSH